MWGLVKQIRTLEADKIENIKYIKKLETRVVELLAALHNVMVWCQCDSGDCKYCHNARKLLDREDVV
jgi:hypothetical protein